MSQMQRLILDTADEGFCLFSAEPARVVAFNQRFAAIFSLDPTWLKAEPTAEEVAKALYDQQEAPTADADEYIARVLHRHNEPGDWQVDLELNDGRIVVGRTQAAPGGERLYTFRDVTAEHRMLQALEAERERLSILVEHAPVAYYVVDCATGRTLQMSRSIRNLTGREADFFIGDTNEWKRHIHVDDRQRIVDFVEEQVKQAEPYDVDYQYIRHDGTRRWFRDIADPIPTIPGASPQMAGVVIDITRQKFAETNLRESEQRFRDLIESIPNLVFYEHDEERRLTYVSPSCYPVLGYTPEELIGYRFGEFHRDDEQAGLAPAQEFVAAAIRTGRRQPQYEVRLHTRQGTLVTWEILEYPILADGRVVGFRGVARDVTTIRKMQQRLSERERLVILGTFAGGLAHDLNNLLLPIRAGLDRIERDPDPKRVREQVTAVRRATDHIAELTKKILMWSRYESSEQGGGHRPVTDVHPWTKRALALCEDAVTADTGAPLVQIEMSLNDPPPKVRIDPGLLQQAVMNLVLNARDAMAGGGVITISVGRSPAGWEEPSHSSEEAESVAAPRLGLRIRVSDDGCGMDEDVAQRAFDPFFSTKARGKSTGLGLALVQSIVNSAEGHIGVESKLGEGTTITIDIPADIPSDREARDEVRALRRGGALIAIANPHTGAFLQSFIRNVGLTGRIDPGGHPGPGDVLWVFEPGRTEPGDARSILNSLPGLVAISMEPRDDRPGWPEGILWLEGALDASLIREALNRAIPDDAEGTD